MAYIFSLLFSLIGIFGVGVLGFALATAADGGIGVVVVGGIGIVIVIVAVPISLFSWLMTWAFRGDVSPIGYSALWLNVISILILIVMNT